VSVRIFEAAMPTLWTPLLAAALTWPHPHLPVQPTYSGRANDVHVRASRVEASAVIDGNLNEAVWSDAALLTGFSQFSPQDGIPAADSTQVLVWYSPTALYVGIRAFEAHGLPNSTLADRDKISADDNIQILIGTFHDRRQAFVFGVNPLGVQMDGTLVEVGQSLTGSWTPTLAGRAAADLSQDFVFASKGRITDYGYEIELRIPFKSLKYQTADEQSWDFNVVRKVQHSGFEDSWTQAKRDNASFLAQSGTIDGLRGLDRGLVLDVNPVATSKSRGAPGPSGWTYANGSPQLGGNVRWGVTNNLMLNATGRPDFAEVESDAGQIVIDPRQSLFFAEKRPFFLDGLEQFSVPHQLVYTRRIAKPVFATKLTGKVAGTSLGFLSAVDDKSFSTTGHDQPVYNILRAQRDIGGQSRLGAAYTDRIAGGDYNRVADVDGRVVFNRVYTTSFQLAGSRTKTGAKTTDASLWETIVARTGKSFSFRYQLTGIDDDFRAQSGFISRPGIVHATTDHRYTWFAPRGQAVETFTTSLQLDDQWQYSHFIRRGDAQDKKLHVSTSTGLRGGWVAGAAVYWETFGFDERLYSSYAIERTSGSKVDTIPFTGVPRIPNRDYVLSLATPQWKTFSGSALYIFGQDENFFEWAQADIHYLSTALSVRPSDRLRVTTNLDLQDYRRRTDRSIVGRTVIPRLKTEYQLTRSTFVRLVSEYDYSMRDDLRDETRTFMPLLIGGKKALATRSGTFRGDYLFSYQPNPGTVLFLGYGSQADALPDPRERFTMQSLVRRSDYFFVKYSYLWRL
jgi:hypothetical protein